MYLSNHLHGNNLIKKKKKKKIIYECNMHAANTVSGILKQNNDRCVFPFPFSSLMLTYDENTLIIFIRLVLRNYFF